MNFNELENKMKTMYQIPNKQTIWEHGISVSNHLQEIITKLFNNDNSADFAVLKPLLPFLYDQETLNRYTIYHDIGKVLVFTKDDCG